MENENTYSIFKLKVIFLYVYEAYDMVKAFNLCALILKELKGKLQ